MTGSDPASSSSSPWDRDTPATFSSSEPRSSSSSSSSSSSFEEDKLAEESESPALASPDPGSKSSKCSSCARMSSSIADVLALRAPLGTPRMISAARRTSCFVAEPPVSPMAKHTAHSSLNLRLRSFVGVPINLVMVGRPDRSRSNCSRPSSPFSDDEVVSSDHNTDASPAGADRRATRGRGAGLRGEPVSKQPHWGRAASSVGL